MSKTSETSERSSLVAALHRGGYYPELVADVLDLALAGEEITAHLLQPETTFDGSEVRRHLTALVLTPSRLIVAHVDDHVTGEGTPTALASTEAAPLRDLRSVVITHGYTDPADTSAGMRRREITISLGWGAVQRLDLEPASCGDPACEADHGVTGAATPDDLVIRVSAEVEGEGALTDALSFARVLSRATACP